MSQQQALLTGLIPLCLTLVGGCDLPRNAYGKTCSESSDCGEGLICVFNDPLQPEGQCDTPPGDPPTPEPGAAEPDVPLNDDCTCQDPEANCLPCEAGFICELQTRSCVLQNQVCLENSMVCGVDCGVCPAGSSCVGDDLGTNTSCIVTESTFSPIVFEFQEGSLSANDGQHELIDVDVVPVADRFVNEQAAARISTLSDSSGTITNTSGLPLNLRGRPFTISFFFRAVPGARFTNLLFGKINLGATFRGCANVNPSRIGVGLLDAESQFICREFDTILNEGWHLLTLTSSGSVTQAFLDDLAPLVLLDQAERIPAIDLGGGIPFASLYDTSIELDDLEIRFTETDLAAHREQWTPSQWVTLGPAPFFFSFERGDENELFGHYTLVVDPTPGVSTGNVLDADSEIIGVSTHEPIEIRPNATGSVTLNSLDEFTVVVDVMLDPQNITSWDPYILKLSASTMLRGVGCNANEGVVSLQYLDTNGATVCVESASLPSSTPATFNRVGLVYDHGAAFFVVGTQFGQTRFQAPDPITFRDEALVFTLGPDLGFDNAFFLPEALPDVSSISTYIDEIVASRAECGDAYITPLAEQCDDFNHFDGDGCSSSCQIEPGYTCPDVGQPCQPQ